MIDEKNNKKDINIFNLIKSITYDVNILGAYFHSHGVVIEASVTFDVAC